MRSASWVWVIAALVSVYLAISQVVSKVDPHLNLYVLQPLLWLMPALVVVKLRHADILGALHNRVLLLPAVATAVIQTSVLMFAGVFAGFGWSPYNHAPLALLGNLVFVATFLAGRELARWYLVTTLGERNESLALVLTWLLLSVTALSPYALERTLRPSESLHFIGTILLPTLAIQFVATYFAQRGGLLASASYMTLLVVFEWFSPILPDLPVMLSAILGIMLPIVGLMIAQGFEATSETSARGVAAAEESDESGETSLIGPSPMLLVALGLLVAVFWFNTGILGVKPMVVQGISMQPTYHTGDLVIGRDTNPEDLKVGDIILFDGGSRDVVHRIINIQQDGGKYVVTTLGDNNPAPDAPVSADKIVGRVVLHVGKIGWPIVGPKILLGKVFN